MVRNMSILFGSIAPAAVWAVFVAYRGIRSMEAEIELLKTVPAEAKITPAKETGKDRMAVIRVAVIAVAIICLIYGFCTGGTADVLTKAVNICTECVGLG